MKSLGILSFFCLMFLAALSNSFAQEEKDSVSYYHGIIKNSGRELTISLKIFEESEGYKKWLGISRKCANYIFIIRGFAAEYFYKLTSAPK